MTTDDTPPAQRYLPFMATFSVLLGAASHAATRRAPRTAGALELTEDVLATFFATRMIAREKVGRPVRAAFTEDAGDEQPAGDDLRGAVGELLTCTRCLGPWAGLAVTSARTFTPNHARTATRVAALGGANVLLHCLFAWMQARANRDTAGA